MTLTALQIEAMLVRHEAAMSLRKAQEIEAIEALRMVVIPSEESYAASMAVAEAKGPSQIALALARKPVKRKPYGSKRVRGRAA